MQFDQKESTKMFPTLSYEEVVAYWRDAVPESPADWARELIGRTALDPDRATGQDLAAAVRVACAHRAAEYVEALKSLTLADLHQGAAEHLAERAEASRRWEQRRRRYPRAGRVIAQQRRYAAGLRRRQCQHEERAQALGDVPRHAVALAASRTGTRSRGAGRPAARTSSSRSSSRGGDGGDDGSGPEGPPPPREREHHPLDQRHVVPPPQHHRSPSVEGRQS